VTPILSPEESKEFLKRGFSRRNFGRIATMLTAGATCVLQRTGHGAAFHGEGPMPPDA